MLAVNPVTRATLPVVAKITGAPGPETNAQLPMPGAAALPTSDATSELHSTWLNPAFAVTGAITSKSVSYTHLDVYKRQVSVSVQPVLISSTVSANSVSANKGRVVGF